MSVDGPERAFRTGGVEDGPCRTAIGDPTTLESDEFAEYEREFKRYTDENLQAQHPECDFLSEFLEDDASLAQKVDRLVGWWRAAHRVVVYTGAGVSTAAGLPDYRGTNGVWTRKLRGEQVDDVPSETSFQPTLTHHALAQMQLVGLVTFVATTNVDGLHKRSGLPADMLSELHGNIFDEECATCNARFERSFPVRTATALFEHSTGRYCELCAGPLRDIIVNFGNTVEHVPSMEAEHDRAWVQCLKADLVVVLGSSLSVPTACDLPEECLAAREDKPHGGRLVIVNKQRTPKDASAALCIHAACDDVITAVKQALVP